jgi:RNA polymerase sigma-70 factor (ECF subfamily)
MIRMAKPETDQSPLPDVERAGSDARLVELVRHGETDAFGQLVQRYEGRLLRVIIQFVRDRELARDLAQETFFRIYQRLGQFDSSRRFGPWLFRIGVNLTLDYLRRRKRRGWIRLFTDRRTTVDKPPDPGVRDPRQGFDLEEEVRLVLEAMPERYRTVLILRDMECFSSSEVSAIVHRKEATVRWRLAEARNMFHHLWQQRQQGGRLLPLTAPLSGDDHDQV